MEADMLAYLTALATAAAGFADAPWWFWLVGATALAILSFTDPRRAHPRYADGGIADLLLLESMASLSAGCAASAAAFMIGRLAAWVVFA
jgi:hypothetical protein